MGRKRGRRKRGEEEKSMTVPVTGLINVYLGVQYSLLGDGKESEAL